MSAQKKNLLHGFGDKEMVGNKIHECGKFCFSLFLFLVMTALSSNLTPSTCRKYMINKKI